MSVHINNDAGERINTVSSDAEAVRWFHHSGRSGDYLAESGELLAHVSEAIFPAIVVRFDRDGQVVITHAEDCDLDR